MNQCRKITISIISLICVLALMSTGVYAATSASFSVSNSVWYQYVAPKVTVNFYQGSLTGTPSKNNLVKTVTVVDGKEIGASNIPTEQSHADYKFLGWCTYDFTSNKYLLKYTADSIVDSSVLTNRTLDLFERHVNGTIMADVDATVDTTNIKLDNLGLTLEVVEGDATIKGAIFSGKGDTVIPAVLYDMNGVEVPIVEILKGKENWENATSITFEMPSNVTLIGEASMPELVNITTLLLPSSLTKISRYALGDLKKLNWVVIPKSVTEIGVNGFSGVKSGCHVYCEANKKPANWNDKWINSGVTIYWGLNKNWAYDSNGEPYVK